MEKKDRTIWPEIVLSGAEKYQKSSFRHAVKSGVVLNMIIVAMLSIILFGGIAEGP